MLSVAFVLDHRQATGPTGELAPAANPANTDRQLRSIDHDAMRLDVLIDDPADAVRPGSVVRWTEVRGTIHYNIHVLSADGDVLRSERTGSPKWTLGDDLGLAAGESYFLRIEAVLPDGGTLNSRHIHFRVAGRQ